MDVRSVDREKEGGGSERRARGSSLLWQAKTAAVPKLQCLAAVPQSCVFVSAYIGVFVCV